MVLFFVVVYKILKIQSLNITNPAVWDKMMERFIILM